MYQILGMWKIVLCNYGGSKHTNLWEFAEVDIVVGINEFGAEPIVDVREDSIAFCFEKRVVSCFMVRSIA
jgi:hypothetical protein